MPSIHAEVGEEHGDHNDPYFTALEIHKDSNILSNITKNYYNRGIILVTQIVLDKYFIYHQSKRENM